MGWSVRARPRRGLAGAVVGFSLSLSITSVAIPILLVRVGHGVAEVGFLVALAAVAQILVRLRIGAVMRVLTDRGLVAVSAALMALGCGLLAWRTGLAAVVVSQLLMGAARGLFWTGVQTYAVRLAGPAVQGLASVSLTSGVGLLLGPLVAGFLLEVSPGAAMVTGALTALLGLAPVLLMERHPVFPPADRGRERGQHRPGVRAGAWGAATAGAWRGLMGTYVPVLLQQASYSSTLIGGVVATANAATILAGWTSRWLPPHRVRGALVAGPVLAGSGLALLGPVADLPGIAAIALVASGLGMGTLQTLAPAVAAESVATRHRGDAMAAVGLSRAVATFVSPLGVGALVLALPLGWAMGLAGLALIGPAWAARGVPGAR